MSGYNPDETDGEKKCTGDIGEVGDIVNIVNIAMQKHNPTSERQG